MNLRYSLYSGAQVLSLLAGVLGAVVLSTWLGEALIPAQLLPDQRLPAAAGVFVLGLVVWVVFGRLRIGRWYAIGRRAGLTPDGAAGLLSRIRLGVGLPLTVDPLPDLAGTVDGRAVRAKTYSVSTGDGEQRSTRSYTVVEAELDEPTGMSVLLGPGTEETGAELVEAVPGSLERVAVDDEFVMIGRGSEEHAEQILTGRARSALLDLETHAGVVVGDPTDTLMDALPDEMGLAASLVSGRIEERLREHPAYDAATVATNHEGLLLNADELERQAAAVAAVADEVSRVKREAAAL